MSTSGIPFPDFRHVSDEFDSDSFLCLISSLPLNAYAHRSLSGREKYIIKRMYKILSRMGLVSILIENDYIDRDYIEDYAGFFSRSFRDYKSKCSRVHFFSDYIDEISYKEAVLSKNKSCISEGYLGFMVVKPLPKSIVGRTCLNYKKIFTDSSFLKVLYRPYPVSFNGFSLNVNSVAFQEQDKSASACSTNSIWTLFQLTSQIYHHPVRSPHAITKSATDGIYNKYSRSFPNRGLSVIQMLAAIREVGIDYDIQRSDRDMSFLKGIIYSYVKYNIPCLLASSVLIKKTNPPFVLEKLSSFRNFFYKKVGAHAVTVVGYLLDENKKLDGRQRYKGGEMVSPVPLKSNRVDKLIIHDDSIGPFCEYEIINGMLSTKDSDKLLLPGFIITPLYHKVRASYDMVLSVLSQITVLLDVIIFDRIKGLFYEWDVFLNNSNSYKNYLKGEAVEDLQFIKAMHCSMPKYIWQSSLVCNDYGCAADFIFDATDSQRDDLICHVTIYNNKIGRLVKAVFDEDLLDSRLLEGTPYKKDGVSISFIFKSVRDSMNKEAFDG